MKKRKQNALYGAVVVAVMFTVIAGVAFWYFEASQTEEGEGTEESRSGEANENSRSGIPIPEEGEVERIAWEDVSRILRTGNITAVLQRQNLEVRMAVKGGGIYTTTEPEIDAITEAVQNCGMSCSGIVISTE